MLVGQLKAVFEEAKLNKRDFPAFLDKVNIKCSYLTFEKALESALQYYGADLKAMDVIRSEQEAGS